MDTTKPKPVAKKPAPVVFHKLHTVRHREGYRCVCSCGKYASRIRPTRADAMEIGSGEHPGNPRRG